MSKKHEQRTRAEILAKRAQPIQEVRVLRQVPTPKGPILVPQPTSSERLRAEFDRSKYMPHFGAKQQAKLQRAQARRILNHPAAAFFVGDEDPDADADGYVRIPSAAELS